MSSVKQNEENEQPIGFAGIINDKWLSKTVLSGFKMKIIGTNITGEKLIEVIERENDNFYASDKYGGKTENMTSKKMISFIMVKFKTIKNITITHY
jgi:hypothetical protein